MDSPDSDGWLYWVMIALLLVVVVLLVLLIRLT